ncbi:MBL fold metallo-hydrolase [Salipaludibacillus sp. LMS25]|jgi:phosphoribosyl 1,2-cyclic phosphodiesterase|uniref:MBL fold metallo-hydrolase n=1 Tax=Salipaludibacillus sp. LMS25 TaxID=2924031 RepID=UPI0020D15DEF|nr:MBL fold metallo-hydrolase [Salipaludibacillus sp. LMS25]UTR16556.1 MBL fold metallo-hydrolase [Salipaludibacillus sp. LMS25]
MTLRFSVLASGSTGNAIYVETDKQRLLIDAGLSGKKIEQCFKHINLCPSKLDGILVSHEHSDHIKGVGILARRYNLPIYANEKTWEGMLPSIGTIPLEQKHHFATGTVKTLGDLNVESFGVSHDAADPMFFSFHHEGRQLTILTDTGYVSDRMAGLSKGANSLIFESNHDMDMLRMGKYPWNIKRRILGDEGHVSNVDAGIALADIIKDSKADIYLAHLSLDNNMKDLARMTVQQTLEENDIEVGRQVKLFDTDPYVPTALKVV